MPPSRVLDMMSAKIRIGQKTSDSTRQNPNHPMPAIVAVGARHF